MVAVAMNEDRLRLMVHGLFLEVEAAKAYRSAPKGGQQVPFNGDFASVPPSGLSRLSWWVRELGRAMDVDATCACGHKGMNHESSIGKCCWQETSGECACEEFATPAATALSGHPKGNT